MAARSKGKKGKESKEVKKAPIVVEEVVEHPKVEEVVAQEIQKEDDSQAVEVGQDVVGETSLGVTEVEANKSEDVEVVENKEESIVRPINTGYSTKSLILMFLVGAGSLKQKQFAWQLQKA